MIDLDNITELEDASLFKLEEHAQRPFTLHPDLITQLSFERSLDHQIVQRESYTVFDCLSDIGGIQSILISAFSIIIGILNYNNFDNHMAAKLYKMHAHSKDCKCGLDIKTDKKLCLVPPKICNMRDYFTAQLPFLQICCKTDRKKRALDRARHQLQKEINIIEIIRLRRIFQISLSKMLSKEKFCHLRNKSRYITIDPDRLDSFSEEASD